MKTIEGFRLREVCGECVIVPEGRTLVNFNKMISLNESAAFLWKQIEGKEFTVEQLADLLVGEYGIDRQTAESDASAVADKWIEVGIVER